MMVDRSELLVAVEEPLILPGRVTLRHSMPESVLRQGVTAQIEVRDGGNA